MKPEEEKNYGLTDLTIWNVMVLVVNSFFGVKELLLLPGSSKSMSTVIHKTFCMIKVEWTPLLEPRFNDQDQENVDPHKVDMTTTLAMCVGLDLGRTVRTLGGEYTEAWRDVKKILGEESVVTPEYYDHINRILTQGCPSVLTFDEQSDSKLSERKEGTKEPSLRILRS